VPACLVTGLCPVPGGAKPRHHTDGGAKAPAGQASFRQAQGKPGPPCRGRDALGTAGRMPALHYDFESGFLAVEVGVGEAMPGGRPLVM
jgi:hypothetical protein